jgi:hypothetical protein
MMVLRIRLTGSVFVSKMSKHDVSPGEGLVDSTAFTSSNTDIGTLLWKIS